MMIMMMPKEGMICFIVFFDNENVWFGEKIKSLSQLLRKFIDFMAAILNFFIQNNLLEMTALHRPRYYYGVLSMHNHKKNKLLSAKTRLINPTITGPYWFYRLK